MLLWLLGCVPAEKADSGPPPADAAAPPRACAAWGPPEIAATVADPALEELSGLVASRVNPGVFWTHEDSGGAAALYALDRSGATLATLEVTGATNVDWEDLALGPCAAGTCLYVGDIGDVGTDRADFVIWVVPEPVLAAGAPAPAAATALPFRYPGPAEDAEALVVTAEGTPLVLSKREDATAGLYRLPPGSDTLERLADLPTGAPEEDLAARVTAADLSTEAPPRLLVRTYFHVYVVDLADPAVPGAPVEVEGAVEPQGEAVAWDPQDGGFWQVAEGVNPYLWRVPCAG